MPRIDLYHSNDTFLIGFDDHTPVNGAYRLWLNRAISPMTVQFMPEGLTSGTAALSVDGEAGENSKVNLANERIFPTNFAAKFIDLDINGVNSGATLKIAIR